MRNLILFFVAVAISVTSAYAHVDPNLLKKIKEKDPILSTRVDCQPAESQTDMQINNVRARLLTGGDIWWDLDQGRYIVPKPAPGLDEVSAIFAGGVWIGGVDPNQNIKLAGVTYRNGNQTDFYPGPLDEMGQTNFDICRDWDRFFNVLGEDILKHIASYDQCVRDGCDFACDSIPPGVLYWPARGNPFFGESYDFDLPDQVLGAFWDEDGDGAYNACNGDFPIIDIRGCEPFNRAEARELVPDEMIFWIYNDNGGPHRLSLATPIQMEVQVQSFAYATNDEVNDMTFYRYKLFNKASEDIRECYFAKWVDPDLGCYTDDYIGCDVERSLAYVYNEDAVDGNVGCSCPQGVFTYCEQVPILGVDYFRGPRGPKVFSRDEDGNIIFNQETGQPLLEDPPFGEGLQDTLVELGMTSFIYNNNAGVGTPDPATTDPQRDDEFYNILRGFWRDGTPITFGGTGFNPESSDTISYVFPDSPNNGAGWSMCTADLEFGDRRTIQATGPLLLQPGAENELIVGAVFVPDVDYPCPDISRLQFADDIAQALFDNCFDITDGPDAPDVSGVELDQQLILLLSNDTLFTESNNAKLEYEEKDLQAPETVEDNLYKFEGYKIYQLQNANVSAQELDDFEKARLIRQVDVKNGVTEIFNWFPLPDPNPNVTEFVWIPERQVEGSDEGVKHSFNVLVDQFATGTDRRLKNHTNYHFMVVAYAYNNYEQFDPKENVGQRRPYLEGRRNVKVSTFTPRPVVYSELQSAFGQGAPITRIDGVGTGFSPLDLAEGERESILDGTFDGELTYRSGFGPISVKVIDPLNIKDGRYRLEIIGEYNDNAKELAPGAKWRLSRCINGDCSNLDENSTIVSEQPIEVINEQIVYGEGFSVEVAQVGKPGEMFDDNNGAIDQVVEYADPLGTQWWSAIPGANGQEIEVPELEDPVNVFAYLEPSFANDPLARMGTGEFIPFIAAQHSSDAQYITPGWKNSTSFAINLGKLNIEDLNNVDVVFTSNKEQWSKCVVVEASGPDYNAFGISTIGEVPQFRLRQSPSVDIDGNEIGEGDIGRGYFPGYAVDVETGQRLNIFFGEASVFRDEISEEVKATFPEAIDIDNGDDMLWNPTTDLFALGLFEGNGPLNSFMGGQHFIYVTREPYDECENLHELFSSNNLIRRTDAIGLITWTTIPVPSQPLLPLEEGLIPNDVTVKLRVTSPYNKEVTNGEVVGDLPVYEFEFSGVERRELAGEEFETALDNVQVVPNPYYAYSAYEQSQFDKTVKVTNLPSRAEVTIYTLDGKFIRRFNRDERPGRIDAVNPAVAETQITPALEWDLTNNKGIPVASGVYIFHIVAPELGVEKSIKWFGVNRRFDPTGL